MLKLRELFISLFLLIRSKIIELKEIPICKLVEELSKREGVEKFKKRMSYYIFNIQKIIKIF